MAKTLLRPCGCFPCDFQALHEDTSGTEPSQDLKNRLRTVFWDTFKRLPERTQTAINDHWNGLRTTTGDRTPTLEISTHPAGAARKNVLAATNSATFSFHPDVLNSAPDEVAQALVAHELAHALLQAKGKTFSSDEEEEQAVPFITFGWGWEDDAIDLWIAEVTASARLSDG